MTKPDIRLDKNNTAVLMVDHQAGYITLLPQAHIEERQSKRTWPGAH